MQTMYQAIIQTAVPQDEIIISRTDLKGKITYANEVFAAISGYKATELIGKPHNIVRHPDMPKSVFATLWETLKKEQMWSGYIKNLRKDGGYYWVHAEVSGVYKDEKLIEYKSMRAPVASNMQKKMEETYALMRQKEEGCIRVGVDISITCIEKLQKLAKEKEITEDKLLNNILDDYLF
ncbi:MAG: PAS domain-containing protein [Sulfurospirillum sp.]|nr:PAS domain-containing protein [Sulfurospirillum sp.]